MSQDSHVLEYSHPVLCTIESWPVINPTIHIFQSMFVFKAHLTPKLGGMVASWLVCSTQEREIRVRALAGDIVLCSWARHLTLAVPLSTQVYKWVPAICWGNLIELWGSDL